MMRRSAIVAVFALLCIGLSGGIVPGTPAPGAQAATAQDDNVAGTTERAADVGLEESEEHGAGEGMPQLNASTYASQILWLIVTFSVLYYLLKRKALPRVADILEARQERISNDLDRAANLRAEAEKAYEEYEKVVADAQAEAGERIKATRDAIGADIGTRTAALDKKLSAKIASAEESIDAARQQALAELEGVAVEVATAATQRLAGIEVSADEARAALAEVRKEVA